MSDGSINELADTAQEAADRDLRAAVYEALTILPEGATNGNCADCRSPIEAARLAILPVTTECGTCAQHRQKLTAPSSN